MSTLAKYYRRLTLQSLRLARDVRGFAAVEFAMIVPIMVIMLMGCVETSDALTVSSRMINISGSVADMVARCTTIEKSDLNDIMAISDSLLGRYTPQALYIEIIAIQADANGNTTVSWSFDHNQAQPIAAGTPYTNIPQGLVSPNGALIIAKATYQYHSPMGHFIHGNIALSHTAYNAPRMGAVTLSTTQACVY